MTGLEESGQHITEPLVALRGLETRTAGRGLWTIVTETQNDKDSKNIVVQVAFSSFILLYNRGKQVICVSLLLQVV